MLRGFLNCRAQSTGQDCFRHYEILASGTVPYFLDLENSPNNTMGILPKKLLLELRDLPGLPKITNYAPFLDWDRRDSISISNPKEGYMDELAIDYKTFDVERYLDLNAKLLAYTQQKLTTKAIAAYVLRMMNMTDPKKVLFLREFDRPDYQQDLLMHGFYTLLGGDRVVEYPRAEHLYDYPSTQGLVKDPKTAGMKERTAEAARKSGNGASGVGYTFRIIPEETEDPRTNLQERLGKKEFDLVCGLSCERPI